MCKNLYTILSIISRDTELSAGLHFMIMSGSWNLDAGLLSVLVNYNPMLMKLTSYVHHVLKYLQNIFYKDTLRN